MPLEVVMPQLGESVVEGTLTKWLVREGDVISAGQNIAEVASDKADSEIPAPVAGRVVELLAKEGDLIAVGKPMARIDETASADAQEAPTSRPQAAPATATAAEPTPGNGRPRASPSVRDLARQLGVDLGAVTPTGEGGRVTSDDIRATAHAADRPAPAAAPAPPAPPAPPAYAPPTNMAPRAMPAAGAGSGFAPPVPNVGFGAFRVPAYVPREGDKVVPFSRKRRITADHMVYSKFVSPQVVTVAEVDLHRVMKLREQHKDRYKKEGIGLTVLSFVAMATVKALRDHPGVNARVIEGATVLLRDVNLGVAVDAPDGLVVPNLKHADELSLRGMARAIGEIAARARENKLTPDDFVGSSFSLTNPGLKGNLYGGAIISQPNVAILRMGEIKKRVVVEDESGEDRIVIRPMMYLALTYDHRVIDGVLGNSFLWTVGDLLKKAEFEP